MSSQSMTRGTVAGTRFTVLWSDPSGSYAAILEPDDTSPGAFARAWMDTDYLGPFTTRSAAERAARRELEHLGAFDPDASPSAPSPERESGLGWAAHDLKHG